MANVFRRLFTSGNLTVDLVYNDAGLVTPGQPPYDVVGCQCFNPDGQQARVVLTNASGAERRAQIPLTQPGAPFNLSAPAALTMIEEVNYHGVTVLTLSHGATIALETR